MKFLFFKALSLCATVASTQAPNVGDFKIIPSPQSITLGGASAIGVSHPILCFGTQKTALPVGVPSSLFTQTKKQTSATLTFSINPNLSLPQEGYILDIAMHKITLSGKDEAGLLYGFATLRQLLDDAQQQQVNLPLCQIKDYPKIAYRPIHLDLKHHLEKKDYYYALMDKLASYKINAVIIEFEDKIKYRKHPLIGSADALSIEEWRDLSEYAHQRHISITPLVQGLGHASFILKHRQYEALRDDPKSDWAFNPLDSNTYALQFDLYDEAMEATPYGKYVHVGGDEVHTNGRHSGKSALELQLIWLDNVSSYIGKRGRSPIFWDDMPLTFTGVRESTYKKMPDKKVDSIWKEQRPQLLSFIKKIPSNLYFMRWNYGQTELRGNIKTLAFYNENHVPYLNATSAQTRTSLMPIYESNIYNIRAFARLTIEHQARGLLLTLWDDDSPLFEMSNRGIVAFSQYAWAGGEQTKEEFKVAYRHREFANALSDARYAFIDELEKTAVFWKNELLEGDVRNYLKTKEDPKKYVITFPFQQDNVSWSTKYKDRIERARQMLAKNKSIANQIAIYKQKSVHNAYLLEVYETVNQVTSFSNQALLLLEKYDLATSPAEKATILVELKTLPKIFRELVAHVRGVYGKIRVLDKPANYILDQDHHVHLGNQALRFEDWQFYAETLFLEKLEAAWSSL